MRKPLPAVADAVKASVEAELAEIVAVERQLEKQAGSGKPNGVKH